MLFKIQVELGTKSTYFDDLAYGTPYYRISNFVLGILVYDLFSYYSDKLQTVKMIAKMEIPITLLLLLLYYLFRNSIEGYFYLLISLDFILPALWIFVFAFRKDVISELLNNVKWSNSSYFSLHIFLFHYVAVLYAICLFGDYNLSSGKLMTVVCMVIVLTILLVKSAIVVEAFIMDKCHKV